MDRYYSITHNHYIKKIMENNLEDYQILDWESLEAQNSRFSVFVNNFLDINPNKTIIDVGCGLGNFAKYLDSLGKNIIYEGYDILDEMITLANKKIFSNINAKFYHKNIFDGNIFIKKYNYLYASGIFNLNIGNNIQFLNMALSRFFEIATDGICFNLLDKKAENIFGEKYFYYDKDNILSSIKSEYADKIKNAYIVDDYIENDFSIVCFLN